MRREQRSDENRCRSRPSEQETDRDAPRSRDRERDQPEDHRAAPELLHHLEVELEPGDEHQVEEPELPQFGNGLVPCVDQAEPVRADRETADHEPDQAGQPEACEDDRAEEDDGEEDEELEDGTLGLLEQGEERDHSSVLISGTFWTPVPSQRSTSLSIVPSAWK